MLNRHPNRSSKVKVFISGTLHRDECYLVNRILIKESNAILKCKWTFHLFNFIEQEQGLTDNNHALDTLLFYQDKVQKENIKLSETIIPATEDYKEGSWEL